MAVAETWEVAKRAIEAYTGLSPVTFFTVLAVAAALYYVVTGFLAPPHPPPPPQTREAEPLLPPVQLGEVTEEELQAYDGSDREKPLLMAIKGQIYDVTQSRMFYGPGGPYALFAGKDASRALAKMSFEPADLTGDISGLGPFELEALQDWEYKFMSKYVKVGTVKKTVPVTEGPDGNNSEIREKSMQTAEETTTEVEHIADRKEGCTSGAGEEAEQKEEVKEKAQGEAEHGA
ncbi:membrane steroid-binding protein 2-like [Canna indica]|uniref:Membrane steroid-binding protein 2-like n=1 Tax=Canna indica TaxID=4628 RepID=A0AAQ3K728_9LILI|nr:membrane steroid-binding protein 2-like [Canna indica]